MSPEDFYSGLSIEEMLKVPGNYAISVPGSPVYSQVEVEADGTCHQLSPDGKRDGVLARDKWNPLTRAVKL